MKSIGAVLTICALLLAGCAREEEGAWEVVQFKVCLRSEPYEKGDTTLSGEFEDLLMVSLPVQIRRGPGETHAVQNGVWLHVAWDDVRVEQTPHACLVFDGFRSFVENRFRSPYGTSWWDNGWQERGRVSIAEEWDHIQTSVGIDPGGADPRIWCRMWRWARSAETPDVILGRKEDAGR